jgi:hypothetical protein
MYCLTFFTVTRASNYKGPGFSHYSYFKLSTGFVRAVLTILALTVNNATIIAVIPEAKNIHTVMLVLYA